MNYIWYMLVAALMGTIKFISIKAPLDNFLFLLNPIVWIVEKYFNVSFLYYNNLGFFNENMNISIGKSCLGINFFIVMFFMIITSFIKNIKKSANKLFFIFSVLIYSYMATILSTSIRIIGAICILKLIPTQYMKYERLTHEFIGVSFYFTYMLVSYYIFSKGFEKWGNVCEKRI
ncbi:exosortase K [Anaeromicrobium sediminis]|uniref:Exosortase K n=1 Tax=Anaeromicrobium sediminis TaxID=1478221 RepID=A0A267MJD7_9FIRM|nr:exosortase K [Anaeromicrobium sediminis]PAB59028.1 exosortase K [Anaeromicrobium sediminis]